ncbi:SDR family NAD(P)-dependent oxidoreductase [Pseudoduganella sp. HUAS MS19]
MDQYEQQDATGLEIAIVGMAGRFPGAPDIETFWSNIRDGVESVVRYTDAQLRERGVPQFLLDDPGYVKAGVPFDGADKFDAGFFGYTPRDAEQLDPQHRLFLECAWEALEHAGVVPQRYPGTVGVYAGSGASLYLMRQLLPHYQLEDGGNIADLLGLMSGNLADTLCTRVAYKLNLRGPAVTVQTACSTSLMAVHTASQALLNHECDMALAGGVSLNLLQNGGYRYQAGAIFSPDGHCRAFDARAAGTLLGSGAGIVVLKRLEDALRDGDTVHAVIKGSAANNDGADKVGFTAPGINGQAAVIRAAQEMAGVDAGSISYVEAHGTGTTLGDPIEIAALTQAFRAGTARKGYCAVGSVKTNIGHLDAAAGVTGLIKTVLALAHRTMPPSLHYEQPNPQIDFAASPFFVNTAARPWETADGPRRAGVSSFGIGGTNVHVVLEEAPPAARAMQGSAAAAHDGLHALQLSARSEPALQEMRARLARQLERQPELAMADVAQTLREGRQRFAHRAVALVRDRAGALDALTQAASAALVQGRALSERPTVAFLFPGQGAQHVDMARALYERDETVRGTVDRCCALLQQHLGFDLRTVLFPVEDAEAGARLAQTALTQPALFVIEYALAQWWLRQGVQPDALLGHSIGEYVAACLAGVFSLEDALAVVAARGRLLQGTAPGAMLAAGLSEDQLQAHPYPGCDLAAVNAPELCVLAGSTEALARAERDLRERGVAVRSLHVSHAFHSTSVEPVLDEFAALLARIKLSPPRIPFVSNVSGRWITDAEACDPGYWVRHMRGTVRFAGGLEQLLAKADRVLLEVGPGETLATLARRHPRAASRPVLSTQCHPGQAAERNAVQPQRCLAELWTSGIEVDAAPSWPAVPGRRVPLPAYPFERRSYWVDAPDAPAAKAVAQRRDVADWFHVPAWRRSPLPDRRGAAGEAPRGGFLLLCDAGPLADALLTQFHAQQRQAVLVERGEAFSRRGAGHYTVRAGARTDFEALLRGVEADFGTIGGICHLWSFHSGAAPAPQAALEDGFYSLLALAQALGTERKLAITVAASQVEDVTGTEPLCAEKAAIHGACKVIGQEYPQLACRLLDVLAPVDGGGQVVRQLMAELGAPDGEPLVAYRGLHRWVKDYASRRDTRAGGQLRKQGVYLVTGGLGGVGLALAEYLARAWQAKLVLLGRSPVAGCPAALAGLEAAGAEVLVLQADVTDAGQLQAAVAAARQRFGALHGVIHAAGMAGGGMIAQRERGAMEQVLAPKVQGTRNLLRACEGEALDFVLLCSSLTAITGGFGQADYCAANCILDAIAAEASRQGRWPVQSVNWDTWRSLGMAAGQSLPDGVGIPAALAGELLERLLSIRDACQVLVSTLDIGQRMAQLQSIEMAGQVLPEATPRRAGHPRPALRTPFVAPAEGIEHDLAAIWSEMLGISPIGAADNLFELGGDSLLAIQLLARVRQAYGVTLHPAGLFETPTVAALALLVEDRLLEEIENAESDAGATPGMAANQ